jgi:nucleoside 2-deoxyribosyltransferase
MKPKVYLAGAITGVGFGDATDWREAVKQLLYDCDVFSPMRCKEYLKGEKIIRDNYADTVLSNKKGITTRDRNDVMRADLLFVNLLGVQRVSIGTVMEIAWADMRRIPIAIAMDEDNPHRHGMIEEAAGFVVPTIQDAIDVTRAILLP